MRKLTEEEKKLSQERRAAYLREYNRRRWHENKESERARRKKWAAENPDKIKEYAEKFHCTEAYKEYARAYYKRYSKENRAKRRAHDAAREARKLQATLGGVDLDAINAFYNGCPPGFQVDHIIPLKNKQVCGLHVLHNLQYLPALFNTRKNNQFDGTYENESWRLKAKPTK